MQIFGKSPLLSHKTTLKQHINEREKPIFKTTTTHLPNTKQVTKPQPQKDKFSLSFFIVFTRLSVIVSFYGLTKGFPRKFAYCVSVSK